MSDELEKRLDTGMYGTPRVNPDEQRKYLGTFRERCYLSMTVAEMKKRTTKKRYSRFSLTIKGTDLDQRKIARNASDDLYFIDYETTARFSSGD